jgi:hypothetical protein
LVWFVLDELADLVVPLPRGRCPFLPGRCPFLPESLRRCSGEVRANGHFDKDSSVAALRELADVIGVVLTSVYGAEVG